MCYSVWNCFLLTKGLNMTFSVVDVVVSFKAGCLSRDIGLWVEYSPWGGGFLRDPSPYLREFQRKPRKIPNGCRSTRATGVQAWHLSSSSLEHYHSATGGAVIFGILRYTLIWVEREIILPIRKRKLLHDLHHFDLKRNILNHRRIKCIFCHLNFWGRPLFVEKTWARKD